MIPNTSAAYDLFHQGQLAFSQIEQTGMRIDVPYLDQAIKDTEVKIAELKEELYKDEVWKTWKKHFGEKAGLGKKKQLGHVIFKLLGHEKSESKGENDINAFEKVDIPFTKNYFRMAKLEKALTTNLIGLKREVVDGVLRPSLDLNTVKTYRGSCSNPNGQNIPTREEEIAKLVRSAFISTGDDYQLIENDFGAIEVRGIACYGKDPTLISYLKTDFDMHKEVAAKCFRVKPDLVSKNARYSAKNMFVFPVFYGSDYLNCSKNMWHACETLKLMVGDIPMREHLANKGITELGACDRNQEVMPGTFEHHVKTRVEKWFWDTFPVHKQWQRKWIEDYQKKGYIETLTGFVLKGVYRRTQIINSCVQGSCFHILLKSLIYLNKWLRRKKMRSRIIMQIHDSIIGNVHKNERDEYLGMVKHITTVKVPNEWEWVIVPMLIEAEECPLGSNWYMKTTIKGF